MMRDPAVSAHWRQFALYLRPLVKEKMTIREFADRIGLSYPHTSRIMTGTTGVSRDTIGKIVDALDLRQYADITRLYRTAGYPPPLPADVNHPVPAFDLKALKDVMLNLQIQLEQFRIIVEELDRQTPQRNHNNQTPQRHHNNQTTTTIDRIHTNTNNHQEASVL